MPRRKRVEFANRPALSGDFLIERAFLFCYLRSIGCVMEDFLKALTVGSTLAFITERIVAALVAPVKAKWPNLDMWWLIYPTWVLGGLLAYAAGINLLLTLVPSLDPLYGRILTAVIVGGGSNLIHDLFQRPSTTTITAKSDSAGTMTATVHTEAPPMTEPELPMRSRGERA